MRAAVVLDGVVNASVGSGRWTESAWMWRRARSVALLALFAPLAVLRFRRLP